MSNLTIRLDAATRTRLERLAADTQRSQSGVIRTLIAMATSTPDGGLRCLPLAAPRPQARKGVRP